MKTLVNKYKIPLIWDFIFCAERPRLELGEHLRVHRLAICCITTLPPLLIKQRKLKNYKYEIKI